jgi:hypothetical protein
MRRFMSVVLAAGVVAVPAPRAAAGSLAAGPVARIELAPAEATIASGGAQAYTARGRDARGRIVGDVTSHTNFTVGPNGHCDGNICSAVVTGTHAVTGEFEGKTATATLVVLDPAAGPSTQPAFDTDSGSVMIDPETGLRVVAIPSTDASDIIVSVDPSCPDPPGGTPSNVILALDGRVYEMSFNISKNALTATIPAEELASGDLAVYWECAGTPLRDILARVELYDPSGLISHGLNATPLPGGQVTLFGVPTFTPETAPDDDPSTCQTPDTRPPGGFDQAPPSDPGLSERVSAASASIVPAVNPFVTGALGLYGWAVTRGCYYVVAEKAGFERQISPMVGVPPAVTGLDLALQPLAPDTTITASPPPATIATDAAFAFVASLDGSTFECGLDDSGFSSCGSPIAYSGLADGVHMFAVRARSPEGALDPTPAARTWIIDRDVPEVSILAPAPGYSYVLGRALPAAPGGTIVLGCMQAGATAGAGPSGIASVGFDVDGQAVDPAAVAYDAASGVWSFEYCPGLPGPHTITARAVSGAGVPGEATAAVVGAG